MSDLDAIKAALAQGMDVVKGDPDYFDRAEMALRALVNATPAVIAEVERLRAGHWKAEGEAHTDPCTYGALCPWCEVKRLRFTQQSLTTGETGYCLECEAVLADLARVTAERDALAKRLANAEAERNEWARVCREQQEDSGGVGLDHYRALIAERDALAKRWETLQRWVAVIEDDVRPSHRTNTIWITGLLSKMRELEAQR